MRHKKQIRILFAIFLLVISTLGMIGCSTKKNQTIIKINKETVSLNEIQFYLAQAKEDFEQQGGPDIWETDFEGKTAEEVAKDRTLDSIIWLKILKNKASEMGFKLAEEEKVRVDIQADQIVAKMDGEQIKKFGLTKKDLSMMIQESILSERVFREVTKEFTVGEEELQEFYQATEVVEKDKEKMKEYYTERRKAEVFQQQYEDWKKQADIQINEERWKEISIHE